MQAPRLRRRLVSGTIGFFAFGLVAAAIIAPAAADDPAPAKPSKSSPANKDKDTVSGGVETKLEKATASEKSKAPTKSMAPSPSAPADSMTSSGDLGPKRHETPGPKTEDDGILFRQ